MGTYKIDIAGIITYYYLKENVTLILKVTNDYFFSFDVRPLKMTKEELIKTWESKNVKSCSVKEFENKLKVVRNFINFDMGLKKNKTLKYAADDHVEER
jgi:predicted transcriptional regulator